MQQFSSRCFVRSYLCIKTLFVRVSQGILTINAQTCLAQIGVGPLVSSQERKASVVLLINRLSAVYQLLVRRGCFSSVGLLRFFACSCPEESFRTVVLDALDGKIRIVCRANESIGVPSCPAPPRAAAPLCAAPIRPASGMSGLWLRKVSTIPLWARRWVAFWQPVLSKICPPAPPCASRA